VPQSSRDLIVRAGDEVRGTQSFVQVMASVWNRPSLVGLEVLWRWAFGVAALWLLGTQGWKVWLIATHGSADAASINLDHFNLTDPINAAERLADALSRLLPPTLHVSLWLVPLLLAVWIMVSTFGRIVIFRRMDASLTFRRGALLTLSAVRVACLTGAIVAWLWVLRWSSIAAITRPELRGEEPNLVLYFAMIIIATLLVFVGWSAVSWVLSVAPLLAMLRRLSAWESLIAATKLGPLRGKLIEINLVMGVVKIALVVLAMVFSATPLPFQAFTTQGFLWIWWVVVALLYLLASDFFHVVRLAACLALCRAYDSR
jgi:hypothetical protein